jgi:16S rRNA (cytidine1402-2'-O)-methyltransferase
LWVIATPIGNLEDITLRALRLLREADLVAAEDTRAARVLFERHGIDRPLVSCFEGNEEARADELARRAAAGERIALVAQAGTPTVSDPGYRVVAAAIAAGVRVEPIPGPCAAVAALTASGLPTDRFLFAGFPPRTSAKRQEWLAPLRGERATLVFYEAPGRVGATLGDLAAVLGAARRATVARELTKLHEELVRGTLGELAERFGSTPPRGEVTLVVAGAPADVESPPIDLERAVADALAAGDSPKEIAARLALATGRPRRAIYQLALALKGRDDRDPDR